MRKQSDSNWRGNPNIQMKYYNEWADPDLLYKDYVFNYFDIEDALWEGFLDSNGLDESDTYNDLYNIKPEYENMFDKYVQDNAVDYLEDLIWTGAPKTWHTSKKNKSANKNVAYTKARARKTSRRKMAADKFPPIDDFNISTSPFGSLKYEWEGNQYYIKMQRDLFKNDYWGWQIAWEDQHNDLLAVSLEHFDDVDDCYTNMKKELLSGAALAVHFDDMKFGSAKRAKAIKPYSKREVPERKLSSKRNAKRKKASKTKRAEANAYMVSYRKNADDKFSQANIVWTDDEKLIDIEFADCDWYDYHIMSDTEIKSYLKRGMPERKLSSKRKNASDNMHIFTISGASGAYDGYTLVVDTDNRGKWYMDMYDANGNPTTYYVSGYDSFDEAMYYFKRHRPTCELNEVDMKQITGSRKVAYNDWAIFIGAVLAPACGKWVQLPCDDSEIDEAIEYARAEYEKYNGDSCEETMIPDYEGPFGMSAKEMEWANPYELNEAVTELSNTYLPDEVVAVLIEQYGIFEAAQNIDYVFYIEGDTEADLAYNYINEMGGIEFLGEDTLQRYFDYESFGRDLAFDFIQGDGYFVRVAKKRGKYFTWGIRGAKKSSSAMHAKTAWNDDLNTTIDELIDCAENECLSYADIALAQDILEMLRENGLQDAPVYFELANAVFGMDPFEARK